MLSTYCWHNNLLRIWGLWQKREKFWNVCGRGGENQSTIFKVKKALLKSTGADLLTQSWKDMSAKKEKQLLAVEELEWPSSLQSAAESFTTLSAQPHTPPNLSIIIRPEMPWTVYYPSVKLPWYRFLLQLGNRELPIPQYTACQALKGSLSLLLQLTAILLSSQIITQKTLAAPSCSFLLHKRKDRWVAALKKFLFLSEAWS